MSQRSGSSGARPSPPVRTRVTSRMGKPTTERTAARGPIGGRPARATVVAFGRDDERERSVDVYFISLVCFRAPLLHTRRRARQRWAAPRPRRRIPPRRSRPRPTRRRIRRRKPGGPTACLPRMRSASPPAPPTAAPSIADDAYVAGATPYTEQDEQWLRSGPMSKALDPNLRVVRVASRCPRNGTPRVLECYPRRVAQNLARSETKGFSKNKWNSKKGDAPVPWPNTFWLCCPVAISKIGKLEHEGFIKTYNSRFEHPETQPDPEDALLDATKFRAQHARYASHRWRLLSPDDVSLARREGYDAVLEKCGVGGLRVPDAGQVPAPALRALPRDEGQPRGRVVPKRAGRKASARRLVRSAP